MQEAFIFFFPAISSGGLRKPLNGRGSFIRYFHNINTYIIFNTNKNTFIIINIFIIFILKIIIKIILKFITNTYIISDTCKNTYINISIFHFIIIINIIIFIKIFITFSYNLYSLTKALIDLSRNLLLKSSFLSLQKLLKSLENLSLFLSFIKRLVSSSIKSPTIFLISLLNLILNSLIFKSSFSLFLILLKISLVSLLKSLLFLLPFSLIFE